MISVQMLVWWFHLFTTLQNLEDAFAHLQFRSFYVCAAVPHLLQLKIVS